MPESSSHSLGTADRKICGCPRKPRSSSKNGNDLFDVTCDKCFDAETNNILRLPEYLKQLMCKSRGSSFDSSSSKIQGLSGLGVLTDEEKKSPKKILKDTSSKPNKPALPKSPKPGCSYNWREHSKFTRPKIEKRKNYSDSSYYSPTPPNPNRSKVADAPSRNILNESLRRPSSAPCPEPFNLNPESPSPYKLDKYFPKPTVNLDEVSPRHDDREVPLSPKSRVKSPEQIAAECNSGTFSVRSII